MPAKALTLVELLITLSIMLLLATASAPVFTLHQKARFDAHAQRWAVTLNLAESNARNTGQRVLLQMTQEFDPSPNLYQLSIEQSDSIRTLLKQVRKQGFQLKLPKHELRHPHNNRIIESPFRGPPSQVFTFTENGFSSGTLVFSDNHGNVLCSVLAGGNRRIRHYIQTQNSQTWAVL